ncbi:MAG: hypothetical protein QW041_03065 [Candidatus Pacearchaeota archaeon]
MGLCGIITHTKKSLENKYLEELKKGKSLIYQGKKYHSYKYEDGLGGIAWADENNIRVGISLEIILTGLYIKLRTLSEYSPKNLGIQKL